MNQKKRRSNVLTSYHYHTHEVNIQMSKNNQYFFFYIENVLLLNWRMYAFFSILCRTDVSGRLECTQKHTFNNQRFGTAWLGLACYFEFRFSCDTYTLLLHTWNILIILLPSQISLCQYAQDPLQALLFLLLLFFFLFVVVVAVVEHLNSRELSDGGAELFNILSSLLIHSHTFDLIWH